MNTLQKENRQSRHSPFLKIINGLLALVITGGILLLSDLENRIRLDTPGEKTRYQLCFAHYVDSPNSELVEKGVRDGLKKEGLTEGVDFELTVYNAQGDIGTLNSITESINARKWDIVFASSTPTIQAFSAKITGSPIVFSNVGDPVRAGLGKSFTSHLPNLTGISTMSDFGALLDLVMETMPGIKTVGTIFTPGEINSVAYLESLKKSTDERGLTLMAVPANTVTEVSDAAHAITGMGIQAFTQISDNLTASCASTIIKCAYDNDIPYFTYASEQLKSGAIASVSRDYYEAGVDAARLAKKVLEGTSPSDIPFEFVGKTTTVVNTVAMNHFKVNIPKKYLNN
jgi:ABC-type uncharacterized transport system substrate-binding protein